MPLPNATRYQIAEFAQPGLAILAANFTFNGTSAPDAAEGIPFRTTGADLTRSDVGDYVLTIPGSGTLDILSFTIHIVDGTDLVVPVVTAISEANRTITFTVYDAETAVTPTDPTDGAKLYVTIWLKTRYGI